MAMMKKKTLKIVYLILFLLTNPLPTEPIVLTALTTVFTMGYSLYGLFNDADDAYRKWKPQNTIDTVIDAVDGVSKQIDTLEINFGKQLEDAVITLLTDLPRIALVNAALKDLSDCLIIVDNLYETFEFYLENKDLLRNETLEDLARTIIGNDADDLVPTLGRISKIVIPGRTKNIREGLLSLLRSGMKEKTYKECNNGLEDQTLVFEIYKAIMMTEARGLMMLGFAYYILTYLEKGDYRSEMELAERRTLRRTTTYEMAFKGTTSAVPNEVVPCDEYGIKAFDHEKYLNFIGTQVKYVINELGIDPNDCSVHCDDRSEPIAHNNCTDYEGCNKKNYCDGYIKGCKRTSDLWVAVSEESTLAPMDTYANEDKEWVSRPSPFTEEIFVGSQTDPNGNKCSTCVCDCVQSGKRSDKFYVTKYIGLREAVSDIERNKVLTGFHLIATYSGIHVVIQQGRIQSQGLVEPDSVAWESVELSDPVVDSEIVNGEVANYNLVRGSSDSTEGVDYMTLNGDIDCIYLDDIEVPKDYVVTGVRLRKSKPDVQPIGLQLEVRATPYDILTGQLLLNSSSPTVWLSGEDMKGVFPEYDRERTEYEIFTDLRPHYTIEGERKPRSERNSYVRLQTLDVEERFGQLTLPAIETMKNFGDPPYALSGIGLYYKSAKPHGSGIVGTKLILLDAYRYMQPV